MSTEPQQALAEQEALLALLVLRANVKANPLTSYIIPPSQGKLDEREAVESLARVQKPVECKASKSGSSVHLTLNPLQGRAPDNFAARVADKADRWEPTLRRVGATSIDEATVLVRSAVGSITIPFRVLRAWYRDYFITHAFSWIGERQKPPPGVQLVIDVDDPAEVTIIMNVHE